MNLSAKATLARRTAANCWMSGLSAVCAGVLALAASACRSSSAGNEYAALAFTPPQPPVFLKGAASLLLTNSTGYKARVTLDPAPGLLDIEPVSGQLLVQGSHLLFLPDAARSKSKKLQDVGIAYLWNVDTGTGYVLCDTLQAYAPFSASTRFARVETASGQSAMSVLESHPCTEKETKVVATDNSVSAFRVSQALDLHLVPLRIVLDGTAAGYTIWLSKVGLEHFAEELFRPPAGFKEYASTESMMTELALRQQNLHRRSPAEWNQRELPSGPPGQAQGGR
jgi:hypothetical protein